MILPSRLLGADAPSNRITVAMIGVGRQGFGLNLQGSGSGAGRNPGTLDVPGAQVVAVCDVDRWRLDRAKQAVDAHYAKSNTSGTYKGCDAYEDFREIIARKDIDAVMISTPDFWHVPMGILAAQAKKHVSCEKPLSMSVHQGRQFVDALQKYGVTNRTDSEFRSVRSQNHAVEMVRNGLIGKLERIEIQLPADPAPVSVQPDMPIPKELNYDFWLGPMAETPYTEMRVHKPFDHTSRPGWMRVDTYAQGMIANWGAHFFDVAQWANNSEDTGPIEVEGKGEFPNSLWNTMINFEVTYRYANGVVMTCQQTPTSKPGIKYIGSDGWISVDGYPGLVTASNPAILTAKPGAGELDLSQTLWDKPDFIEAIRTNRQTLEPIATGHRTISISQIGLIACQLGGKLKWDPKRELFDGDNAANARLAVPLARKEWSM
jgi:myo-inositol 2-dehydrogenase / D-chiro-inositol 1-dehydrogenase